MLYDNLVFKKAEIFNRLHFSHFVVLDDDTIVCFWYLQYQEFLFSCQRLCVLHYYYNTFLVLYLFFFI